MLFFREAKSLKQLKTLTVPFKVRTTDPENVKQVTRSYIKSDKSRRKTAKASDLIRFHSGVSHSTCSPAKHRVLVDEQGTELRRENKKM